MRWPLIAYSHKSVYVLSTDPKLSTNQASEDCVAINMPVSMQQKGMWTALNCRAKFKFVCKMPAM